MNVVDSSGWLEYFANKSNADFFAPAIEDTRELIIPSISLYEVFKRVMQQRSEDEALRAISVMAQGLIVNLDVFLALRAAKISKELGLPMADRIIFATARAYDAILWTQDADFMNLEGVKYVSK